MITKMKSLIVNGDMRTNVLIFLISSSALILIYFTTDRDKTLVFLIAPPFTHVLAVARSKGGSYNLYMPFKGNRWFVILQGIAWTSYGVLCGFMILQYFQVIEKTALGILSASFLSHLFVSLSMHYRGNEDTRAVKTVALTVLVLTFLHALPLIVFLLLTLLVTFTKPIVSSSILVAYVLFTSSFINSKRDNTISSFRKFIRDYLIIGLKEWHREIKIIRDIGEKEEVVEPEKSDGKIIFCYGPHGLIPHSAAWLYLHSDFQSLFPNRVVNLLVASIIFKIPIVREVFAFLGARSVCRDSFFSSLKGKKAAILFSPGGMSELVESVCSDGDNEIVMCTRHKGFIAIAKKVADQFEEKVTIVPILAFGEIGGIKNIFPRKWVSKSSYRYFGFPFPFLPVGMFGISPFPSRNQLYFVIGKGIVICPNSARSVEEYHASYFEEIKRLFEKHKELCNHSAHLQLRLTS